MAPKHMWYVGQNRDLYVDVFTSALPPRAVRASETFKKYRRIYGPFRTPAAAEKIEMRLRRGLTAYPERRR